MVDRLADGEFDDPDLPAERLEQLADEFPELHARIVEHPNCPAALKEWIFTQRPAIRQAVERREARERAAEEAADRRRAAAEAEARRRAAEAVERSQRPAREVSVQTPPTYSSAASAGTTSERSPGSWCCGCVAIGVGVLVLMSGCSWLMGALG